MMRTFKRNKACKTIMHGVPVGICLLIAVWLTTGMAVAQQSVETQEELPIADGPEVHTQAPDWAAFDGGGRIGRLALPKLVISDAMYHLADDVKIYSGDQKRLSTAALGVGDRVGFTLNAQCRIDRIWILPKKK